jgi:N-acetylmuramoyl-L-alanine amidase
MRSIERVLLAMAGLLLTGLAPHRALGQATPAAAPPTAPPAAPPAAARQPATPAPPAPARYLVLIDPAHGGDDAGATLKSGEPEREVTLQLALRLRALLQAHGIATGMTRTTDVSVDETARANRANRSNAAACIVLHATSSGSGVHLFTSSLPPAHVSPRGFLPWQTAQASFIPQSLRLESNINTALTAGHLPVLMERTFLKPLDNLACPAVAVEIAPLSATAPVSNRQYRDSVLEALTAALSAWRTDRRQP